MHTLAGDGFAHVIIAGTHAVLRSQEALDRINVFPVADADTGTNLVATLTAATAVLGRHVPSAIGSTSRIVADAALGGARGNSGAIFAQFLDGLAEGLTQKRQVDTGEFALAANLGVEAAYLAVQHPREGTILTVLRAWAAEMTARASAVQDFREVLDGALHAARSALAETPQQLEVLRRNKVVDAGGQGLVFFLEGWLSRWKGQVAPAEPVVARSPLPEAFRPLIVTMGEPLRAFRAVVPQGDPAPEEPEDDMRYCAHALVDGQGLDREAIQEAVAGLGVSLVVAGGSARMSVHLHTDHPERFRQAMEGFGTVETFKVDDLVEQQSAAKGSKIALVIDSTSDLSEAAQLRLGTVMIPLTISIGGREYLDKVELGSHEFYRLVRQTRELPRSSQPSPADFRGAFVSLLEEYEGIVSIHLSARISGTFQAALAAAKAVDERRIRAVDSRHVSVGTGLVVEAAGEVVRAGGDLDQVVAAAEAAAQNTRVYGATPSLDFAVKGGRVSKRPARIADLVQLKPIILFDGGDGTVHLDGAHIGFDRALRGLARRAVRFAGDDGARLAVTHADSPAGAEYVLRQLRRHFSEEDIPLLESGAVLATHTGLGAVAVAVRRLSSDSAAV